MTKPNVTSSVRKQFTWLILIWTDKSFPWKPWMVHCWNTGCKRMTGVNELSVRGQNAKNLNNLLRWDWRLKWLCAAVTSIDCYLSFQFLVCLHSPISLNVANKGNVLIFWSLSFIHRVENLPSFIFITLMLIWALLILAVSSTRVTYEPSKWPSSPRVSP